MSLINFGSILGFAEEIETQNMNFFSQASGNPECGENKALFEDLAKSAKKRIAEIQRVKRENVTEMVLESIEGFQRDAFVIATEDASALAAQQVIEKSKALLDRSLDYYEQAATKLKGQADVARALKVLAKKSGKDLNKFN
jgi:hypothetical protein